MSTHYQTLLEKLRQEPRTWLITGCAGFIGSNLLETLLKLDQRVTGLDNFITGYKRNLDEVRQLVTPEQWSRFSFVQGDLRQLDVCHQTVAGADFVLHQAALGSVPRSLKDPITTNAINVDGFLNIMVAARDAEVRSFVYAASSSASGEHPDLHKVEENIGKPLSPYAATKYINELYADVFAHSYGFGSTGLRYLNVFGKRQDPNGAYAAVIPRWIAAMIRGEDVVVNDDGETSHDFCFVDNAVQANLLAALAQPEGTHQVYNVGANASTRLNELFGYLTQQLGKHGVQYNKKPIYKESRPQDMPHAQADNAKTNGLSGYQPMHDIIQGLEVSMPWYTQFLR